jgi:hypothetical protein
MTLVSKSLRDSAGHPDAHCMLQIPGVCGDATDSKTAGCVLCHVRLAGEAGFGQKPDDTLAVFGCGPCHAHFDSNGVRGLRGSPEWFEYALRGVARTQRWWREHGYLSVKGAK